MATTRCGNLRGALAGHTPRVLSIGKRSSYRPAKDCRGSGISVHLVRKSHRGPQDSSSSSHQYLKGLLDSSNSYDERRLRGPDQAAWVSSAFHDSEAKSSFADPKTVTRSRNEPKDRRDETVLLFPGQGSQFVGMVSASSRLTKEIPAVRELFEAAGQVLGYDLLKICSEGPKETLDRTKYCQPAVVVTSLAAVEALYLKDEDLVKNCVATAGFSVGEITALIFSGALSLTDGLRLVKVRAEAMEYASNLAQGGMMTVFYGADHKLSLACEAAKKWTLEHGLEGAVCQVANHLYAGAKTLAGHEKALRFIADNRRDFGIRAVKVLPVSGAFHSPLMNEAVGPFREALSTARLQDPRIAVFSNVTGKEYRGSAEIASTLPKQIVKCVRWEQTMHHLYDTKALASADDSTAYPRTFECGPGNSLSNILSKVNGKVARLATSVGIQ